ncbi:hypothetical protein F5I97DRAFT_1966709 [Phlebopus sp. FC_14]|nr:hypothetical protein F5I97DRAFT_1966709 [Phlebopus sp. FC_14]
MLAPTLSQPIDGCVIAKDVAARTTMSTMSTSQRHLISLPPELLVAIFMHSDCQTMLRCCRVCRRFKDIIDASVELQYIIELVLDGMIDGGGSSSSSAYPSITDRLNRLRQLRHSWLNLTWRSAFLVPIQGACYAYEFVGGIFCKTSHAQAFRWGSRQFNATWLPSSAAPRREKNGVKRVTAKSLTREDLGVPTRDFAIDPSQDLIVLFKGREDNAQPVADPAPVELHVRTISTNKVHPDAKEPVLETTDPVSVSSAFIQIADDIVGMLFYTEPERPRLTLWNWKTGKQVVSLDGDALPPGLCDFSFISNRAFFSTTIARGGMIQIFTFGHEPSHPDTVDDIVHVTNLVLPPLRPAVHMINLTTHTGPFLARCPPNKPFTASNESRVHVLNMQYINPVSDGIRISPRFCAFFHNRILVDCIRRYEAKGRGEHIHVPWENWGPTNTRFLQQHSSFQWLRYVHGQRVVIPRLAGQGRNVMQVLDFNVRDCSRQREYAPPCEVESSSDTPLAWQSGSSPSVSIHPYRFRVDGTQVASSDSASTSASDSKSDSDTAQREEKKSSIRLVDYPTAIDQPMFFTSPIETRLPYREMRREELMSFSGVMIDDERLVGLKNPVFSNGDMRDIHVFAM